MWNGNAFTEVNVETTRPKGVAAPHLTSFRKVLKGQTFKRGRVETRGRPQAFTAQALRKIDQVRKDLIKKAKGEMEVLHGRSAKAIWIRSCQG